MTVPGTIYSFSPKKQNAMEDYVQEALKHGYIVPSISLISANFFFVEKNDRGLRPCIWLPGFKCHHCLVPAALEQLSKATIFTKLDLHKKLITRAHTAVSTGLLKKNIGGKECSLTSTNASLCSSCAQAKVSSHLPAATLLPLPNPQCPWSHLALDVLTDLPESDGNTIILVVLDCFFRSLCLLPLPKLPASFKLAKLLLHHVFCYFSLLKHIVSDPRPSLPCKFS